MLKEGPKSWSLLRKREGVSSCREGSFWRGLLLLSSWFSLGVLGSSLGFISFSTERHTLLWKRPKSSGVTALPLWGPSRGTPGEGGGRAGFCEPPMNLSSSLSKEQENVTCWYWTMRDLTLNLQEHVFSNKELPDGSLTWWIWEVNQILLLRRPLACSSRLQYPVHGDCRKPPLLSCLVLCAFRSSQHQMSAGQHAFPLVRQAHKVILDTAAWHGER